MLLNKTTKVCESERRSSTRSDITQRDAALQTEWLSVYQEEPCSVQLASSHNRSGWPVQPVGCSLSTPGLFSNAQYGSEEDLPYLLASKHGNVSSLHKPATSGRCVQVSSNACQYPCISSLFLADLSEYCDSDGECAHINKGFCRDNRCTCDEGHFAIPDKQGCLSSEYIPEWASVLDIVNENRRPNTSGNPNQIPVGTLMPSEGFVGSRENLEIFIIIYWLVRDDRKARGDFRYINCISVQCWGDLNV
jgi:hypothetical protein